MTNSGFFFSISYIYFMKNIKRTPIHVAISIVLLVFLVISAAPLYSQDGIHKTVSPDDFFSLLAERQGEGRAVLLDVRTPDEVNAGAAPGSENIDFYDPEFRSKISSLDKDETYFLYCRSGNRSGQTLRLMKSLDFSEVYDLSGGWSRNAARLSELPGE